MAYSFPSTQVPQPVQSQSRGPADLIRLPAPRLAVLQLLESFFDVSQEGGRRGRYRLWYRIRSNTAGAVNFVY